MVDFPGIEQFAMAWRHISKPLQSMSLRYQDLGGHKFFNEQMNEYM